MTEQAAQHVAMLIAPMTCQVQTAPLPEPAASQVRIRLEGCGICASNLPVWEGRPWFSYPLAGGAPGHEGWGRVDAIGSDVDDLDVGERVAVLSSNAYARYDLAERSAVLRLPRELDAQPFPGEPLGCAMNIFARSDIRAGHDVAIVGAGFLGLLLTQLASRAGANVVAISRRSYALQLARRCGAADTLTADDARSGARARDLTGHRGFDRVIEVAGLQSTLDLASALCAEYGRLVIAGYHQDGLRQIDMQQWNWKALDVINAHERSPVRYMQGMQHAIKAVLDGRLDPFPLLTHSVALGSLDRGFELTRARPDGFIKALLLNESRQ